VLDVGCGNGEFLRASSDAGWRSLGCDPDPKTVQRARAGGFEVRLGGIEAWADAGASFDAVTLNHVIEHLHDPLGEIAQAWRLLKPGGTIYIETPNVDALGHALYGPAWRGLEPPRHLVLFSWGGLTRVLRKAGFERPRRISRPGVFSGLAVQSVGIANNPDTPANPEGRRIPPSFGQRLQAALFPDRSEFIALVARKPNA
jgi:SAM-dependent methyltransferase